MRLASSRSAGLLVAAAVVGLVSTGVLAARVHPISNSQFMLLITLALIAAAVMLARRADPAILLCSGLAATVFSGNWGLLGFPEMAAPDRFLLAAGVLAVLLRAPPVRDRPVMRFGVVHWLLLAAAVFAASSAVVADTLLGDPLELIDRLGIAAFICFAVAPIAFAGQRQRDMLMWTLVGVGVYLGATAWLETTGPEALVFPSFITDPSVGIHYGRARGPFLDAATNAATMYACAIAAVMAIGRTQRPALRVVAGIAVVLCGFGILFSLQRTAWVGAAAGTMVTLLVIPRLRIYVFPVLVAGVLGVVLALALVPGLADSVQSRADESRTVWDRRNVATAATRMAAERPLFGFGWNTFREVSEDYFWQPDDIPLTAHPKTTIHNAILADLAEIGLVGTVLWLAAILAALVAAWTTPGPPELLPWRAAVLAFAVFWLALALFTPAAKVTPMLILLLWAGVAAGPGLYATKAERGRLRRDGLRTVLA